MTGYYKEMLEKGLKFQDFVVKEMYKKGIPIVSYNSKEYQYNEGENVAGFEIKFDDCMAKTGNLYIEISEKSSEEMEFFTPSGIYRNDNSWIYLIGNYSEFFLFAKKHLQAVHKRGSFKKVGNSTSNGIVIPKKSALEICVLHVEL